MKPKRDQSFCYNLFNRSRRESSARPSTSPTVATTPPGALVYPLMPLSQASPYFGMLQPRISKAGSSIETRTEEVVNIAWEGVKTALVLLKESSDWFPELKAATDGLLSLIHTIELVFSNAADLELLRQKIVRLTSIIEENSRDRRFPWLLRRLFEFSKKLNEIAKGIEEKSNHGKLRRFAEGKKDKGDITTFIGAISDLVSNLQSELALYSSRGINELLSNESLKKLKESEAASYNALLSAQLVQRRGCTPNTRQKILDDLIKWAKDPHSSRLYWMNGMVGTGKTAIAYSFCERLQEKGLLGANFFCSRSLAECSDIRHIIPTVVRQLARSCPQFASSLLKVLGVDFQLPSLGNQLKRLLSEPFQHISEPMTDTLIIVIDALDECNNEASEIRLFLEKICNYVSIKSTPLKVFITSRPENVISRTITSLTPSSPSEWSVGYIHDIEESLVPTDIKTYVEDELTEIAISRRLEDGWPPATEVDAVVTNTNGLFIYAATVIRYVGMDSGNPRRRLSELATSSRGNFHSSSLSTQLIDELYRDILERAFRGKNEEEDLLARMVLKLIVCAQTPLTLAGIVDFLNESKRFKIVVLPSDVRTALKLLPSVISRPTDDGGVATTFHASFSDFLFDSRRCGPINHVPFRQSHQDIARLCLHLMKESLTADNITRSGRWETVDAILKQKKIGSWVSSSLAYSCMFWGSHILTDDQIENLSTELEHFLMHELLRWFEVLSLLRRLDIGVEVLQKMEGFKHATLPSKFHDAYKFLKDVFDIISIWPTEVFHSGLVWAPEQSFMRKTYFKTQPVRIVSGHRSGWGACELILWGHSDRVNSVAVSPDSSHVVSGSKDKTVQIWNSLTGEEEHVLRGHSHEVHSVAVSNHHVVSGSSDNTIRIWNVSTGEEEHILRGHTREVYSVAISDCHVVSGSFDHTVRIWNASTGKEKHTLHGHSDLVTSVTIFPDDCHAASGSFDKTVRVWNMSTGKEKHVLRRHSQAVHSVAVSNRHIVSGSFDHTVRIWNASTGDEEHVLLGHSDAVSSVAFMPENCHIVSGSPDKTIRIWDASTGDLQRILQGHSGLVTSVAVSPAKRHIVSGSDDNTVRIWDVDEEEHVFRGHIGGVYTIAVSPDKRHVVSGSRDNTIRIWNASTGEEEHVLQGHSNSVYSVTVSPDNCHIVSGSLDTTIRIWNMSTGKEEQVLRGHSSTVNSLAVTPDNCHVVSGSSDNTVRIWNISRGEEEHILRGHSYWVYSVAVSPDGSHIVSGSRDNTIRIWNASTGDEEHILRGHSGSVYSVAVTPDNCHIVSGSEDNTVRIWDASTRDEDVSSVISFVISSDNCLVMSEPQVNPIPITKMFLSSMVTLLAEGDDIISIPVIRRLASGESCHLDVFLGAIRNRSSLGPVTLTPDGSSILLSNGQKCLVIPSTLRDIDCAAFSGSNVFFGHGSGKITILDIST